MRWEERKTPLVDLRAIPLGPLRLSEVQRLVAGFAAMPRLVWFLGGTEAKPIR